MTVAFLVLGPIVIGYITVSEAERFKNRHYWQWVFTPWLPVLVGTAIVGILNLEGLICIVFALPITLLSSSIGGIGAGLLARWYRKPSRTTLACVAFLPMLIAPLEMQAPFPQQVRTVETQIEIRAPAATVWNNIEQVRTIAPEEIRPTWTHAIGFPRPVAATLSYKGVGGVRHASFERGLVFIETVTAWNPDHALAFSIKADTEHIPPTTLDEHVTIGGRYFDVLKGEYRLASEPNGTVVLHLSSQERLSTDFNGYAGLWTDAVMRRLQRSILEVVKARCERPIQPT